MSSATEKAAPSEEKELALVEKVEMRLALAKSPEKFQGLVKTYLAPLMLKLVSPHQAVREEVSSICQHILKRIDAGDIFLPVVTVFQHFRTYRDSALMRLYGQRFILKGIDQLRDNDQVQEFLIALIKGISGGLDREDPIAPQLLHFLLRVLSKFELPRRGSIEAMQLRETLGLTDQDTATLAVWFAKLQLLIFRFMGIGTHSSDGTRDTIELNPDAHQPPPGQKPGAHIVPPGLSHDDVHILHSENVPDAWNPEKGGLGLMRTKRIVLEFVACGNVFNDEEKVWVGICAQADVNPSAVTDKGELLVGKRPDCGREAIENLYALFSGSHGTIPASIVLRTKILQLLTRSRISTEYPDKYEDIMKQGFQVPADLRRYGGSMMSKYNTALLEFSQHVMIHDKSGKSSAIAGQFVSTLRQFITSQRGRVDGEREDPKLIRHAYELLARCAKVARVADVDLLEWLLKSLDDEDSGREVTLTIEECLSGFINTIADNAGPNERSKLEELVYDTAWNGRLKHKSVPYILARYANQCLPYHNTKARFVDILAVGSSGDRSFEAGTEGRNGLNPYTFKMMNSTRPQMWEALPDKHDHEQITSTDARDKDMVFKFPDFANFSFTVMPNPLLESSETHPILRSSPIALGTVFIYSVRILINEILRRKSIDVPISPEWEHSIEITLAQDLKSRAAIREDLREKYEPGARKRYGFFWEAFERMVLAAIHTFSSGNRSTEIDACEGMLIHLLMLCPSSLLKSIWLQTENILNLSNFSDKKSKKLAARTISVLLAAQDPNEPDFRFGSRIDLFLEYASNWASNNLDASTSIEILGVVISRFALRSPPETLSSIVQKWLSKLNHIVLEMIDTARDEGLLESSYFALGELSTSLIYQRYPFLLTQISVSTSRIIEQLSSAAKSGNEKAADALARFSTCFDEETQTSELETIDKAMHDLHGIRAVEAHFRIGEAQAIYAAGWECSVLQHAMDGEAFWNGPSREKTFERVMVRTIRDCRAPKPALRRASVIWLLCMLQACGDVPAAQKLLPLCQRAFRACLVDREEVVQEAAARGLGLVYEKGEGDLRKELVQNLVSSFAGDAKTQKNELAGMVDEDTQLFEEGALRTNDGSITTYRDILDLAKELGDPSLVYKFMALASHNAVWKSRAAFGRFGLSRIFEDGSVDEYLGTNPKLYSTLYRYQFDPSPKVQESMKDIWNAVVKDKNAALDANFSVIIEDLLEKMIGKEWRTRHAACYAIARLVEGRDFNKVEPYVGKIWEQCAWVMDDINDSAQKAGWELAKTLLRILTRGLEGDGIKASSLDAMLDGVLEFLLSPKGIESKAKNVQVFAVGSLLEIVKKGDVKALEKYVVRLVPVILGMFSVLEPIELEYARQNASRYDISAQDIDDMRVKAVIRGNPFMDALDRLLDLQWKDPATTGKFIDTVRKSMRTTMGTQSHIATAKYLVSMYVRHPQRFAEYGTQLLPSVRNKLLDDNETISAGYVDAAGYICRWTTNDAAVLELMQWAWDLWLKADNDHHRTTSAQLHHALSRRAPQKFDSLSSILLPRILIARFDPSPPVRKLFTRVWDEHASGASAATRHHDVALLRKVLDDQRWGLKHAASSALASVAAEIADSGGESVLAGEVLDAGVWQLLKDALRVKTWDGKGEVLVQWVRVCEGLEKWWSVRGEWDGIWEIALRESRRKNPGYQTTSLPCLSRIACLRPDLDLTSPILDVATSLLEALGLSPSTAGDDDPDAMDVDVAIEGDSKKADAALANTAEALGKAFSSKNGASYSLPNVQRVLALVATLVVRKSVPVRREGLEAVGRVFDRARVAGVRVGEGWSAGERAEVLGLVSKALLLKRGYDGMDLETRRLRVEGLRAVVRTGMCDLADVEELKVWVGREMRRERDTEIKRVLEQVEKDLAMG